LNTQQIAEDVSTHAKRGECKIALFLSSGDPDIYDRAQFSYAGNLLGYLGLESAGIITDHEEVVI